MFTQIVWNGTGILCCVISFMLISRTIVRLHKEKKMTILLTILLGILLGFLGVICSTLMLLGFYSIVSFDADSDVYFSVRAIIGLPFFYLGALFIASISKRLLYKVCHIGAVVDIIFIVTMIIILQPIIYGWIKIIAIKI